MTEPFEPQHLLDDKLSATIGSIDADTRNAIIRICSEALETVLGSTLFAAVAREPELLPRTAPWARDLARGLHFHSRYGPGEPPTAESLGPFSKRYLAPEERRRCAETVDVTMAVTLDRLLEPVLGPSVSAHDPSDNGP